MPADLLEMFKRFSLENVKLFEIIAKLEENGKHLFPTGCLS